MALMALMELMVQLAQREEAAVVEAGSGSPVVLGPRCLACSGGEGLVSSSTFSFQGVEESFAKIESRPIEPPTIPTLERV